MNRRSLLLAGGTALAAFGAYRQFGPQTATVLGETIGLPMPAAAQTGEQPAEVDLSRVVEMAEGNPDAAVTIIEFASFTCPHCATFNQTVYRQLKEQYIDTGLVRFVYREVYFDAYGLWASLVARCGGEMRYFGIVDMLYAEQREWTRGADANAIADNLRRIGRRAGMNDAQMNECLADRDMAMALMQTYQNNVEEYGVRATPSFVINGTLHSNMSFDEFQSIIDPLLADAASQ